MPTLGFRNIFSVTLIMLFLFGGVSAPVFGADFRIEAGVGWTHADFDVSDRFTIGPWDVSYDAEGAGGSGLVASAGVWADDLIGTNVSVGLQYLRFENSAEIRSTINRKGRVPGSVNADFDIVLNAGLLNLAWRLNQEQIHPYVGAGIGVSLVSADVSLEDSPFFLSESSDDTVPVGQVFAGFDYDISDRVYVGLNARYLIFAGDLFGVDVDIRELAGMGVVGFRF